MRAAEKLVAENGVENVSIREIVATAKQKNESALQYHFSSLTGLLIAIHQERSAQIQAKRDSMMESTLNANPKPKLRELCALMVEPSFELARANVDFRRYIKAFGLEPAMADTSPLKLVTTKGGAGGSSGQQLGNLLKKALPHLDEQDYRHRLETAILVCSTSMYQHARQKNAFRGPAAELFLNHLLDGLFGLLSAPVSTETQAIKNG